MKPAGSGNHLASTFSTVSNTSEDMYTVGLMSLSYGSVVPGVFVKYGQHFLVFLQREDCRVVVLDHNPFVLWIFNTTICSFISVVTVYSGIERAGDNDPDGSGRPFYTGSGFVSGSIEHPGSMYERFVFHVVALYHLADLFLVLPDEKLCFIWIIVIPKRYTTSVP